MRRKNLFLLLPLCLFVAGCSQGELFNDDPDPVPAPVGAGTSGPGTASRSRYRNLYDQFVSEHKQIFKSINRNKTALRNSGNRAVDAVDRMLAMIEDDEKSELEETADRYRSAWDRFDVRSPSIGERKNLEQAGKAVRRAFKVTKVDLLTSPTPEESRPRDRSDRQPTADAGRKTVNRTLSVRNVRVYRKLIDRWKLLHDRFKNGLVASDPMFTTTYQQLNRVFDQLIRLVPDRDQNRSMMTYYRSQYRFIYRNRDEYLGTRKMDDHLSVLRQKFLSDFGTVAPVKPQKTKEQDK